MKNYSLKNLDKELSDVILNDIKPYLEGTKHANPNVLRVLTPDISLRKGKYGQYIFYKTSVMSKTTFFEITRF